MKFKCTIFLIMLITNFCSIYATTGYVEFSLITDYNANDNDADYFVTATSGTRWDDDYLVTTDYDTASLIGIPEQSDLGDFPLYGWNYIGSASPSYPVTLDYGDLCHGLYKFVAVMYWPDHEPPSTFRDSFYLDMRDADYSYSPYTSQDAYIKYKESDSPRFSRKRYAGSYSWHSIANGDTVSVRDLLETTGTPSFEKFQPINPSGLSVTTVADHPKLTWNGTPELDGVEEYIVYRGTSGAYNSVASNLSSRTWTDEAVEADRFGTVYQYKVRAVSGDSIRFSAGYSNVVTFTGDGPLNKSIGQNKETSLPLQFIATAYPNPFNPNTTIEYTLSNASNVSVLIFDVKGRVVFEYHKPNQNIGTHTMEWHGNDNLGSSAKTGMYFARIQAGENTQVVKLVYLK